MFFAREASIVIDPLELSVVIPCLNEAKTIAECIAKARTFLARSGIVGEILVADNGSTDGSQAIAEAMGARVVDVPQRGYGNALIGGIRAARGTYVITGDSDGSHDLGALDAFIEKLRAGYELVIGNRFRGGIQPGAMSALHRYFGNPILSAVGRIFFHNPCGDFHCGLRGFDRRAILGLDLQTSGMEFASEMVVKATINNIKITEVPTIMLPDGRGRPPHLRSWRDGWRHLRFMLLFGPRWLFLYPGFALFTAGLFAMAWLLPQPRRVGGIIVDIHTLFYASIAVVVGFQYILFWVFTKIYGAREGIVAPDPRFKSIVGVCTLEVGLITAGVLLLLGLALGLYAVEWSAAAGFGPIDPTEVMRLVIPSGTSILLAFQTASSSFFISVLEIRATRVVETTDAEISAHAA
jgi:glycosyltransferase involved in cell wall biosynthesis